jgi:hypothetical protein
LKENCVDIKTMRLFFEKTGQAEYHTQLEGLKDKGLDYFNSVVFEGYPGGFVSSR